MEKGKFKENYQLFKKAWKDPKYKAIMKLSLYLIFIFILILMVKFCSNPRVTTTNTKPQELNSVQKIENTNNYEYTININENQNITDIKGIKYQTVNDFEIINTHEKYTIKDNRYKLIYSNDIKNESDNPIIINDFIGKYKERLLNRRECKKKLRLWYELQWGREKAIFERKKIMYPYKSFENRFAIDENNSFSSADVYSFYINKEYEEIFSYEYLVGLLNSEVYNKYFKINAKKISKNAYDYYPNKVMKIKIFKDSNYTHIEDLSKQVLQRLKNGESNISDLEYKINNLIRGSLGI